MEPLIDSVKSQKIKIKSVSLFGNEGSKENRGGEMGGGFREEGLYCSIRLAGRRPDLNCRRRRGGGNLCTILRGKYLNQMEVRDDIFGRRKRKLVSRSAASVAKRRH